MIRIRVTNKRQAVELEHAQGLFELGRGPRREVERCVIEDPYVSRDQLQIDALPDGHVWLTNLGAPVTVADPPQHAPIHLKKTARLSTRELAQGERIELTFPLQVNAGYTTIEFISAVDDGIAKSLQTLSRPIMAQDVFAPAARSPVLSELGETPTPDVLTNWFERLLRVQKAAAGSDQFYQETAEAIVELIGLDRGLVLLYRDDDWDLVARYARHDSMGPEFSRKVLSQILREKRTYFQGLKDGDRLKSLAGVEAVVASPILDEQQAVKGVVYGCRDLQSATGQLGIKKLEAQVVQLLAAAVSTGLVRVQREMESLRARVQFEQFFSHELAQALENNPKMLDGQQREVSALFVDIRKFSRISERLGAADTYELLHDVMDLLTDQVMSRGGVVIDYYGDGLAAMWNAPVDRDDHAQQACEAALAMHSSLPRLNAQWQPRLGFPLRIGTGINTGAAQVGNAGSSRRLKYGPLGHTVNLASRVEGATKQFGVNVLVTEATRRQLTDDVAVRRVCRVRVVGIQGDAVLYEVQESPPGAPWLAMKQQYESALDMFEAGSLDAAHAAFARLLVDFPDDKSTRVMLEAIEDWRHSDLAFESIVTLRSK